MLFSNLDQGNKPCDFLGPCGYFLLPISSPHPLPPPRRARIKENSLCIRSLDPWLLTTRKCIFTRHGGRPLFRTLRTTLDGTHRLFPRSQVDRAEGSWSEPRQSCARSDGSVSVFPSLLFFWSLQPDLRCVLYPSWSHDPWQWRRTTAPFWNPSTCHWPSKQLLNA